MSPRQAWPRSWEQHERKAAEVLARYAVLTGWQPTLPVPVELVIERVFSLQILSRSLPAEPGEVVLGALYPEQRTICLNEEHEPLFATWIGPEGFTLAHELGHWLYDAIDPSQQSLFEDAEPVFCRGSGDPGLDSQAQVRERNADRFAARLLLPEDLVRREIQAVGVPTSYSELRELAAKWGVSRTTMRIRLEELRLLMAGSFT